MFLYKIENIKDLNIDKNRFINENNLLPENNRDSKKIFMVLTHYNMGQ
jgi:hypothetical protein